MESEKKFKLKLQDELKEFEAEGNSLAGQIKFSREWISKLEERIRMAQEGDDQYAWRSVAAPETKGPSWSQLKELEAEKKGLQSLESQYSEILRKIEKISERLKKEDSREFEFGWGKKDLKQDSGGSLGSKSTELDVLKTIAERGGETGFGTVSSAMRLGYDYSRCLCMSLARKDFIDITARGTCKIASKGERELEKKGYQPWL